MSPDIAVVVAHVLSLVASTWGLMVHGAVVPAIKRQRLRHFSASITPTGPHAPSQLP